MAGLPRHWLQDDEMERMRVLLVLALLTILTTQVHAFVIARVGEKSSLSSLFALNDDNDVSLSQSRRRRNVLKSFSSSSTTISFLSLLSLLPSNPVSASLLEEYGSDPTTIDNEKQKKGTKVDLARDKGKPASNMEPNLRSNYYYPTNKVRYLPRIKKCSDSIPAVADAIGNEDWDVVQNFATVVADDAILPMKLYVSSLSGGGTNVKVGFSKDMMTAAKAFEKSRADLVKSTDKRDVIKSSAALESMAEAMLAYRSSGRLLGPDGGGDIPSVDEIRRSTKRAGRDMFEAKVKERDARLKAAVAGKNYCSVVVPELFLVQVILIFYTTTMTFLLF